MKESLPSRFCAGDCFGTAVSRNESYVTVPDNDCTLSIRDWEEGIFASKGTDMIFLS